ncbi:MAG: HEAT repeat domain-containing protein [Gemmataceae bacterium]
MFARVLVHLTIVVLFAIVLMAGCGQSQKPLEVSLTEQLNDDDPKVREKAARSLESLGPKATNAVPALVKALDDKKPLVRYAAAEALDKIGPGNQAAVPAWVEALKNDDDWVRNKAAQGFGQNGAGCQRRPARFGQSIG